MCGSLKIEYTQIHALNGNAAICVIRIRFTCTHICDTALCQSLSAIDHLDDDEETIIYRYLQNNTRRRRFWVHEIVN